MIEIRNVVKEFDGFRALDGLNMTVPDGAVYGLVGPNGAGKSTIIRHLTGIYRQDSGDVLVDGEQVFENPAVKNRIAYIPDDIFYFSNARIGEMASFYRSIYPQFDSGRFKKLGEVFDLDPKRQMRKLSKGMQKQAAFWMMMSLRPDILVLDEPVDGLDPVMRRQIWSIVMSDVAENGTSVLISSHNLRELEDVCDHVGIMNRGKIMIERTLSDLQEGIVKMQLALPDGETLPDGLDPAGCQRILETICDYREKTGSTVVIVSHSMDDVARIADRLIVFNHGSIRFDGTPEEVFSNPKELSDIGLSVPAPTQIASALREQGVEIEGSVYTTEQLLAALLKLKKEVGRNA